MTTLARGAFTAGRDEAEGDGIANAGVTDAIAERLDDPSALVAGHGWQMILPEVPVDQVEVRMADASRSDAHLHLARSRRIQEDVLDLEPVLASENARPYLGWLGHRARSVLSAEPLQALAQFLSTLATARHTPDTVAALPSKPEGGTRPAPWLTCPVGTWPEEPAARRGQTRSERLDSGAGAQGSWTLSSKPARSVMLRLSTSSWPISWVASTFD